MNHRLPALVTTVVIAAIMLAGCTSPTVEPTPGPSASSEVPTAEPTPEPLAAPVRAFDGDCNALVTLEEAAALLGGASAAVQAQGVPGTGTIGMIECQWITDASSMSIGVASVDDVDPAVRAAAEPVSCDPNPWWTCAMGAEAGGLWFRVTWTGPLAGDGAPQGMLDAAALSMSRVADSPMPESATPLDSWWTPQECTELGAGMDVATLLTQGTVAEGGRNDARPDVLATIAIERGVAAPCVWNDGLSSTLSVFAFPGGAWAWNDVVATVASPVEIQVQGATAAVTGLQANGVPVGIATDGVNVVRVVMSSGDLTLALARAFAALAAA